MPERLDLLDTVEPLSIPSYGVDRHGTIRWLNPAAREFAENVIGRHFTDVVAQAYRPRTRLDAEHGTALEHAVGDGRQPAANAKAENVLVMPL